MADRKIIKEREVRPRREKDTDSGKTSNVHGKFVCEINLRGECIMLHIMAETSIAIILIGHHRAQLV